MTLTDMLKVATGRKLSKRQMEQAKTGDPNLNPYSWISPENYEGDFDNLHMDGKNVVRRQRMYALATTPDFSYGMRVPHTNYYPRKSIDSKFDENGLLLERSVLSSDPKWGIHKHKTVTYNPAGRFIGTNKDGYIAKIVDGLKILMGRKLSQKQMERAKTGDPHNVPGHSEDRAGTFDNLAVVDGKIVQRIKKYAWRFTPDASEGEKRLHEGYYVVKDEIREYDMNGMLNKRTVWSIPGGMSWDVKSLIYEPAGRFMGRTPTEEDLRAEQEQCEKMVNEWMQAKEYQGGQR